MSLQSALEVLSGPVETTAEWQLVSSSAREIADALGRLPDLRTSLGSTELPLQIVRLLQNATITDEATTQLLRVIGNLCIGEQDVNRQRLLDEDAAKAIAIVLSRAREGGQIRAGVGASLNLGVEFQPARAVFVSSGLYSSLLALLQPTVLPELIAEPSLARSIASWTMQVIEDILTAKTPLSSHLLHQTIATLVGIIVASTTSAVDVERLTVAAELLEALTLDEDAASGAFVAPSGPPLQLLESLCNFIESAEPPDEGEVQEAHAFNNAKAAVCKAVTAACADRTVGVAVFAAKPSNALLRKLVIWLENDSLQEAGSRADLVVTAAISLANLARKDESAIALIRDYQLAGPLGRILRQRAGSSRSHSSPPGENTQILHGVLGLLKHLAIPPANKVVLGALDVIELALGLLSTAFDLVSPIQHGAVGLLKHLGTNNQANALRIISAAGLGTILDLIDRSDDFRLRSEATRILCQVIRSLWLFGKPDWNEEAKQRLDDTPRLVQAVAQLIRSSGKYVILVNEGILALTLLASLPLVSAGILEVILSEKKSISEQPVTAADSPSGEVTDAPPNVINGHREHATPGPLSRDASILSKGPSAAGVMLSSTLPPEVRVNVCTLIEIMANQCRSQEERQRLAQAFERELAAWQEGAAEPPVLRRSVDRTLSLLAQ